MLRARRGRRGAFSGEWGGRAGLAVVSRSLAGAIALGVALTAVAGTAAAAPPFYVKLPAELNQRRYTPVTATLPNGNVLVAGGSDEPAKTIEWLKSAEVLNTSTLTLEKLPAQMAVARNEEVYAALPGGEVLIAGGYNGVEHALKSAELFSPATSTFAKLPAEMTTERDGASAAVLHDGKVLIVGGFNEKTLQKTAELFNPETRTFEKVSGEALAERYEATATTLPDGKVLIAGGSDAGGELKTAELFNPETGAFEALASEAAVKRREAASVALQDGEVLILGGHNETKEELQSTEVFNPVTGVFQLVAGEMAVERAGPGATLLQNGKVLIAGGVNEVEPLPNAYLNSTEVSAVSAAAATTGPASGITTGAATLTGTALSEALGRAYFQYGPTSAYGSSTPVQLFPASLGGAPFAAAVAGLAPATTYHYRLVAENGTTTAGADQTFTTLQIPAPVISSVRQSASRWRRGTRLAHVSTRVRRPPVGTTFSFALNEPATVTFSFTQRTGGRRVGHRCLAQTPKNRHRGACKRTVTVAVLSFAGHPATNSVSFLGRVSRTRRLRPGRYSMLIGATNSAGLKAVPRSLTFTIVR
jgi:N-acetylneuraminic acid mutarotase